MGQKTKVLVVQDDGSWRNALCMALESDGYECLVAQTEEEAILALASFGPAIMVLDLDLPQSEGLRVLSHTKGWPRVIVLALSDRAGDADAIRALDEGAHEYATKPLSAGVVVARVRALERCRESMAHSDESVVPRFVNGSLCVDYVAEAVFVADEEIHLTPHEYRLLCLLSRNVGSVLTHQRILHEIWGGAQEGDLATLRVLVGTLRKKIEDDPSEPRYIQTRVGVGYRMVAV